MKNKKIIVDGVDVSGCDCYCDGKCLCEYNEINRKIIRYYSCNKFPNCYYKQLKAKEQECEELKIYIESNEQQVKEVETLVMDNDRLINELDQLKAENENWQKEYWKLEQGNDFLAEKNSKLKGCLTEIKEIAEKQCVCGVDCIDMKQILQKISEVEDG